MAVLNFDASQVKPDEGRVGALPAGWYKVIAEASEIKPTKNGDGHYLAVTLKVFEGDFAGRKIFTKFNLKNPNPQAVEIGYAQLSAFAHAVGVLQVQDSQQLHGIPLKVKVKVRPAQGEYEASNDITAYKNQNYIDGSEGNASAGAAAPQYASAPPPQQYAQTPPPAMQQQPQQFAQQQPMQQAPQQGYQQPQQQPMQQQQPWANGGQAPQQPWQQGGQQQAPQQYAQQPQQQPMQQPQQQYVQQQAPVQQEQYNPAATQAQQASPPWQQ